MPKTKNKLAATIVENVGGPENVDFLTHCATRLRFTLKDNEKLNKEVLDSTPGILSVVVRNGQTQVVIGNNVAEVYGEVMKEPGMKNLGQGTVADDDGEEKGKKSIKDWLDVVFDFLSDTFRPILWALIGASMVKTLIIVLNKFHVSGTGDVIHPDTMSDTFKLLSAAGNSTFYFLPVMVGATAAIKLKANPWVSAAIAAAFLDPSFLSLGAADTTAHFIGIPYSLYGYSAQVFPPIFAACLLAVLERYLKKWLPATLHTVLVPMICLLVLVPLTALVVGPIGINIGKGLSNLFESMYNVGDWFMAPVVAVAYLFMVPLGVHWPLNAVQINNIAQQGSDYIMPPMGCYNFAVFGLVAGVMIIAIREKNNEMRQISMGGVISGLFAGISEPSLFGVVLRFRRTIPIIAVAAASGGLIVGFFKVVAKAFVFTSLLTIPSMESPVYYALGLAVSFFMAMFGVLMFDYRTADQKAADKAKLAAGSTTAAESTEAATAAPVASATKAAATSPLAGLPAGTVLSVSAPLEGKSMVYTDIPDPVFASGSLGKGVGIEPTNNVVVAPTDAKVLTVQKTGHAIGLRLSNGIDLLIHVGIDTVEMKGEGFEVHVARGDEVKAGTKLITFDPEAIKKAGYPATTAVLVTNSKKFAEVEGISNPAADFGTEVIRATTK